MKSPVLRRSSLLFSFASLAALAGCGLGPASTSSVSPVSGQTLSGRLMGGQQPVTGSTVTLYAPGQNGYGSAPTVLSTTTTGAGGGFQLPAYTCPSVDAITYIVATGGNSGSGANSLLAEAAVLPRCSQLSSSTNVQISEVTTVAAAFSLAQFATLTSTGLTIGTTPTNITGLNNAFGTANNLANFSTGNARTAAELTGITPPTSLMATLADILAACINSTGTGGSACNTLISNTTYNGVTPANTLQAAFNIALAPGRNVANLFALASANPPYPGGLSTAPQDFSLALAYTGNGISAATTGVAIDAVGNAWVSTGEFNNTVHQVTEISPAGLYLSGATGYGFANISGPEALAVNSTGQVYVACAGNNNVVRLDASGNYLSTISTASFHNPNGLSVGGADNIWVSSFNGSAFTRIDNTTLTENPNSPFASGVEGVDIANSTLGVWVANFQSQTLTHLTYGTFALQNVAVSSTPSGLAIDASDNVYATLVHGIVKYSDGGTLLSPSAGYQGTATLIPQSVIVDGLGRVFTSVTVGGTSHGGLLEFDGSGNLLSPSNGYAAAGSIPVKPAVPGGIAIDGSGNVWITGDANGTAITPTVSEVIGMAAPVVTPRAVATQNGTIASRP